MMMPRLSFIVRAMAISLGTLAGIYAAHFLDYSCLLCPNVRPLIP